MRELTKSMTSLSWAMSLFGARQMINVLRPSQASHSFEAVTRATEGELDETLRSLFRVGDRLQRSVVDATFGLLTGGGLLDPGMWGDATRCAAGCVGDATRTAVDQARGGTGSAAGLSAPLSPPPRAADDARVGWGPIPG